MFDTLKAYLIERLSYTEEQAEGFRDLFIPQKIEKGKVLLREGDVARIGAFVTKGCLRSYVIDSKGKEHIIQFAPENWWIAEQVSMSRNQPSMFTIDAVEDTQYLAFTTNYFDRIMEVAPQFRSMTNPLFLNSFNALQKRLISLLSATGEERYVDFMKMYPEMGTRLPQKMIASYLGVTPETLSRIRKELVRK